MDPEDSEQIKGRRKKPNKITSNVPLSELGFKANIHPDVLDPRNMKSKPHRRKKKYHAKSTKQHFMARLSMVINFKDMPADQQSHLFKVSKKSDWVYVKKVFYRTRQHVFCSICLEENIVAPQITYCGHIYCFHCILMHFTKSSNSFSCPVCKQLTQKTQLKTCELRYDREPMVSQPITFSLKYRQGHYVFDAYSLQQDLSCTQIIRMKSKAIIPVFEQQLQQIKKQLSSTAQTDRNHSFLVQALQLTTLKITHEQSVATNSNKYRLRQNQTFKQDTVIRFLTGEQAKRMNSFYQQSSGSLIFIHKICQKYWHLSKQNQPYTIKSHILQKQDIDFENEDSHYREISLFDMGLEIDAVIIDISGYATEENNQKFMEELKQFENQRKEHERKQEIELKRLKAEYEEQQQYIRKLKERQQSQYYFDVKLPPTLDPSEINEYSFPSLMSSTSQQQQLTEQQVLRLTKNNTTTESKVMVLQDKELFPDLSQLTQAKSEQPKGAKNGRKRKKEKKIDVTNQFLFHREQYDQ